MLFLAIIADEAFLDAGRMSSGGGFILPGQKQSRQKLTVGWLWLVGCQDASAVVYEAALDAGASRASSDKSASWTTTTSAGASRFTKLRIASSRGWLACRAAWPARRMRTTPMRSSTATAARLRSAHRRHAIWPLPRATHIWRNTHPPIDGDNAQRLQRPSAATPISRKNLPQTHALAEPFSAKCKIFLRGPGTGLRSLSGGW